MKFQRMRPKSAAELKIPDLAGGLNLRDGLSEVLDNQLTDSVNVWWNDGLLKTRPGIKTKTIIKAERKTSDQIVSVRVFPYIKHIEIFTEYILQVTQTIYWNEDSQKYNIYMRFDWICNGEAIELNSFTYASNTDYTNRYFVFAKDNILYLFTGERKIYKLDLKNKENKWYEIFEEKRYVPLIVTGCKTTADYSMQTSDALNSGTMIDGYNLIGNYYEMEYILYNDEVAHVTKKDDNGNPTEKQHMMIYSLLTNLSDSKLKGKTLTATITHTDGTEVTHTVTLTGEKSSDEGYFNKDDGLRMFVWGHIIYFNEENKYPSEEVDTSGGLIASVIHKKNVEDINRNLKIKVPYYATDEELDKVFQMTRCEWFGGGATGIAGGTRLFLCGNTKEEEKNLVIWSGLNNPLYFSENAYFYVGDNSSAVTGFGKQSNMLVIFKENEIWYTQYQQNTNITVEDDLINQNVIDYAASSVYFPLVQINSNIGCSYPDTVQLCRNRLVWLGNDSKVYTLVSENQYNERSIFCVSEMVERSLKKTWPLNSSACDWNGYYCLSIDDKLYLMDYNCYGYTHVSSYSKTEDANIRIPWYCWELPIRAKVCTLKDKMVFSYYHNGEGYGQCAIVSAVLSEDNEHTDLVCQNNDAGNLSIVGKNINSSFTTKLFDFGQPHVRKNIERINLQLGNNGGAEINVRIITESGEEEHSITLLGNETKSYTPGYIDSKAIFPCIRQVLKVGLQFSSTGIIAIDGMNFKYRTTGVTR